MGKLGYKPLQSDSSIYSISSGIKGITIITYVNDFLIIRPDIVRIQELKKKLGQIFSMKDIGPYTSFLGIRIIRDRKERTIHIVQDQYINKVV